MALWSALAAASVIGSTPQAQLGAVIFRDMCASCHGTDGQGVANKYDEPLAGSRSLSSLARFIERKMPEEKPEACIGDEARQVADYIYNEFYSFEARRKKGLIPRIELARLTLPQYRNAAADLLGLFTPLPTQGGERGPDDDKEVSNTKTESGLRAEYYQSKGMSKADQLQLQRIDRDIDFDFGEGSPSANITADQFTIIWDGALAAEDTGHYEFRVRTENGARLYLNSENTGGRRKLRDDSSVVGQAALIDAWVSSGEMREQTARVFLLGGRQYPLRLEFFKYKEKTASVRLEWKPPHGTWAVLNHHYVNTARVSRTFVVETPFPADDRSFGYERGSSVSRAWQGAVMNASIATAAEVVNRLPLLAGFEVGDPQRMEHVSEFVARFAAYAYRRPLTSAEDHLLREVLFADATNPEATVRRAILFVLQSPNFLYTDLAPEGESPSQHTIASRLSFALWDSIPDKQLLDAAISGALTTAEQIEAQARRMIADPRARAKIRGFFHEWLELDERDLAKDKSLFPEFDEAVIADLRYSLNLFLEQVVWSEESDYRQLLLADYLILNEHLRGLYESNPGGPKPAGSAPDVQPSIDFIPVVFPADGRAGVLTHPYLLSAFAYHNNTSPIHRGVFLTRNIVGRRLKPPPMAVAFKEDEFAPDSTMREKITQLTRDKACISCHSVINPLGFALENYDAVGRWRTRDKDKPVDTKSQYVTDEGSTLEIQSARDVANYAVTSESAHRAFVTQVFHHLVKQNPSAYGPDTVDHLRSQFEDGSFNIQNLVIRIAALAASHDHKTAPQPEPTP
ncbi:MAG: DUF1592 domain-containing protein [Verrucomicrobia bacterium]|nr:DUF1592 domain-containing protein [Verrucomicrobiota bacterium]